MEFDLSDALAALGGQPVALPVPPSVADSPATPPAADLESVFEAMRPRSADYRSVTDGAALFELGLQRLEAGQVEEALADLERASRVPALRFSAAARLGREYVGRGRVQTGIHWLERAAEMPPPSPEDGLAVLYDLAVALQENEEHTRALAVLMEIESEAGEYRDVRERIDGLARQPKGRRA
jgi:tetratricopeptide (TPR) repeat protein